MIKDTIVALSSPPGLTLPGISDSAAGGGLPRAIIRLSGARAMEIASAVFTSDHPLNAKQNWRRIPGRVTWRSHQFDAAVLLMLSPRSYTREDVAEIHYPGLRWLTESLLERLAAAGARPAKPGEFTRRAYENGRISLSQAGAVAELISSRDADRARAFAAQLADNTRGDALRLKTRLEDFLSWLELGLDFTLEDVTTLPREEILSRLSSLIESARALSGNGAQNTGALRPGVPGIVLTGASNAGKSSLFNALLGRNAAIVSADLHTTRDTVDALWPESPNADSVHQCRALLSDSAGGADEFEHDLSREGWARSLRGIRGADILALCLDRTGSAPVPLSLLDALRDAKPAAAALIWNKCDLPPATGWVERPSYLNGTPFENSPVFQVSAKTGSGLEVLREYLLNETSRVAGRSASAGTEAGLALKLAAARALAALESAQQALNDGCGEDVAAVEVREAVHALWEAEGILRRHDAVTEAALDRIFADFCIGK